MVSIPPATIVRNPKARKMNRLMGTYLQEMRGRNGPAHSRALTRPGSEAARSLAIIKTRPAPSVGVTIRFTPVSSTKEDDETARNSHELLRSRYKGDLRGAGFPACRTGRTWQTGMSAPRVDFYNHSFIRSRKI